MTAYRIICFSMLLYFFGSCVVYFNVVFDQFESVVMHVTSLDHEHILHSRALVIVAFALLVMTPLCLLRRIESLQFTSALAVFSIVYLAADVIARAAMSPKATTVKQANASIELFQCIPIIAFALQCHLVYVPVYKGLAGRSLKKGASVGLYTFLICLGLYLPTGAFGYSMYGDDTAGDIVASNLPWAVDTGITRLAIALTATFSYPLLHFVARTVVADVITGGKDVAAPENRTLFYSLTAAFIGLSIGVAVGVPQIKVVLGFTGSIPATAQIFIFPGLMWIELGKRLQDPSARRWRIIQGWVVIVFGVVLGCLCTYVTIINLK
jgi:amino acid permease